MFSIILFLAFPAMARTQGKAKDFSVDTSTFDKNLDVTDNTVQKALERLDETLGGTGEVILRVNGVQASYANLKDSTGGVAFTLNGSDITAAFTELDPVFGAWDKSTGISITESQISDLKSYLLVEHEVTYDHSLIATALQVELDPGVATHESTYDHSLIATALQIESDPVFSASEAANFSPGDKLKLDGIEASANNYSLPTASADTLGGVKVGSGLSISGGVLSANAVPAVSYPLQYEIPGSTNSVTILEVTSSDNNDSFLIRDGASTSTSFVPSIEGYNSSNSFADGLNLSARIDAALFQSGYSGDGMEFRTSSTYTASYGYNIPPYERLFTFKNHTSHGMTLWSSSYQGGGHSLKVGGDPNIPEGKLHVATNGDEIDPVLFLEQNTSGVGFVNFDGTSAADQTGSISTVNGDGVVTGPKNYSSSAGWEYQGMIKILVNGDECWIPYYAADTN